MYGGMPYYGPSEAEDKKPVNAGKRRTPKYPEHIRQAAYLELLDLKDRQRRAQFYEHVGGEGCEEALEKIGLSEKDVARMTLLQEIYDETI